MQNVKDPLDCFLYLSPDVMYGGIFSFFFSSPLPCFSVGRWSPVPWVMEFCSSGGGGEGVTLHNARWELFSGEEKEITSHNA